MNVLASVDRLAAGCVHGAILVGALDEVECVMLRVTAPRFEALQHITVQRHAQPRLVRHAHLITRTTAAETA